LVPRFGLAVEIGERLLEVGFRRLVELLLLCLVSLLELLLFVVVVIARGEPLWHLVLSPALLLNYLLRRTGIGIVLDHHSS